VTMQACQRASGNMCHASGASRRYFACRPVPHYCPFTERSALKFATNASPPARSIFAKLTVVLVAFRGVRIKPRYTHCLLAPRRAETPTPLLHIKFYSLPPLLVRPPSRARVAAVTADLRLTKYPPVIDIRRQSLCQVTNLPFSARLTLGSVHSPPSAVATAH
jgi:hypothetical protein